MHGCRGRRLDTHERQYYVDAAKKGSVESRHHRSSRRIRFVACASPCRARRLGYVAAGLAGAPRRDPCVAPSTTLICCWWWCLVVVRTRASTHCSRAVCYCATLLVGACCFFLYCWCCIYYHQNAWISSRNTSRSFRCVWLGQPSCPRASSLVRPILTND